jgi:hypothetical protein
LHHHQLRAADEQVFHWTKPLLQLHLDCRSTPAINSPSYERMLVLLMILQDIVGESDINICEEGC